MMTFCYFYNIHFPPQRLLDSCKPPKLAYRSFASINCVSNFSNPTKSYTIFTNITKNLHLQFIKWYGKHVARFYGRLRLISSVLRASKFPVLKLIDTVNLWVYYTIPFGLSFFRHFLGLIFQLCQLISLA